MAAHSLTTQLSLLAVPYKVCRKCHKQRPEQEFFWRPGEASRLCRVCRRPHEQRKNLRRLYGITLEEFDKLKRSQHGVCAICARPETIRGCTGDVRELSVDHDHETGKVRGLLCNACNRAIGHLRDDPEWAEAAAVYLRRHGR